MKAIFEKLTRFFKDQFQLAVLDMIKGRWILKPESHCIAYLKAENANGRHILIRPDPQVEPYFIMADDLNRPLLTNHHKSRDGTWKPGRLAIETSPANYQVWIRSSRPLSVPEKRFWLHRLCSDPGADPHHRWGRCPGFRNRKQKHRDQHGGFPLAKMIWVDWKYPAQIPLTEENKTYTAAETFSPQPQGGVCRQAAVSRKDFNQRDNSATDFAYALALARRGYGDDDIKERIVSERSNWKNHHSDCKRNLYLDRTIIKIRVIIQNS